jgi:hypothetical protein
LRGFRKASLRCLTDPLPLRRSDTNQYCGKINEAISEVKSVLSAARVECQGEEGDDASEHYN